MLKVPAAAEKGFWGLIRACIAAGGHLRRVAEGVAHEVHPPPRSPPPNQLALWVLDAEQLPPRPWRVYRDTPVACAKLRCVLAAHVCVARQVASEAQRTTDVERGQAPDYPHCQTALCAQGRGIRAALDPVVRVEWKGAGPNARFDRGRRDAEAQRRAYQRLAAVGLVDDVPSLDAPPEPVSPGEDGEEA